MERQAEIFGKEKHQKELQFFLNLLYAFYYESIGRSLITWDLKILSVAITLLPLTLRSLTVWSTSLL